MHLYKRQVLHYEDTKSDKIYILEMFVEDPKTRTTPGNKISTLITSWGRRTSPRLSSQVKFDSIVYWKCSEEFNKLERSKRRAGYERIPESNLADFHIPGYARKILSETNSNTLLISNVKNMIPKEKASAENLHRNIL